MNPASSLFVAQPFLAVLLQLKIKAAQPRMAVWPNEFLPPQSSALHPDGASIFLTWRLHGSLPVTQRTAWNGCATKDSPVKRFKLLDNALDKSSTGPHWLQIPRIAGCVVNLIHKGDSILGYFALHAFVVMPNHIHLLITPKLPIPRIMNGLKGATARAANDLLRRKGKRFWQDESFDRWVRTSTEFDRIRAYIEFNPVSAGLATKPEEWPWSSASPESPSL